MIFIGQFWRQIGQKEAGVRESCFLCSRTMKARLRCSMSASSIESMEQGHDTLLHRRPCCPIEARAEAVRARRDVGVHALDGLEGF
jgi:hypothetical protein